MRRGLNSVAGKGAGKGAIHPKISTKIRSALSFVLEDGNNPSGEQQLEKLRTEYGDVTAHDSLAMALEGYAELAAQRSTKTHSSRSAVSKAPGSRKRSK